MIGHCKICWGAIVVDEVDDELVWKHEDPAIQGHEPQPL